MLECRHELGRMAARHLCYERSKMRPIAGAILILAGCVLIASGVLAEAIDKGRVHEGLKIFGGVVVLAGIMEFAHGLKRVWGIIQVTKKDGKKDDPSNRATKKAPQISPRGSII